MGIQPSDGSASGLALFRFEGVDDGDFFKKMLFSSGS